MLECLSNQTLYANTWQNTVGCKLRTHVIIISVNVNKWEKIGEKHKRSIMQSIEKKTNC